MPVPVRFHPSGRGPKGPFHRDGYERIQYVVVVPGGRETTARTTRTGDHLMIGKSPQPLTARRRPVGGPLRRGVLRTLFTLGMATFTGGALARIAGTPEDQAPLPGDRASRGRRPGSRHAPGPLHRGFDEMYRGRRIQGRTVSAYDSECEVLVDGRPLHLMRCANGGYLSLVDHYQSYPTPLEATRAAVDELGSARLAPATAAAHGAGLREERGAHA
uniref:Putative tyrosinase co-factor protein n=1 Tax=Streptomyces tenjimariensis TaxID=29308 RepID=Q2UZB6_9ACTN|nr:putative tyrosinase co-factor protein [Streptomyces tenjimariensis]